MTDNTRQQHYKFLPFIDAVKKVGNMVEFEIVSPLMALTGDPNDALKVGSIMGALAGQIIKARPGNGPLCLTCGDYEFLPDRLPPSLLVILAPYLTDWSKEADVPAIVSGICPHCAKRHPDELRAAAFAEWKKAISGAIEIHEPKVAS